MLTLCKERVSTLGREPLAQSPCLTQLKSFFKPLLSTPSADDYTHN